jgi:hypothetical protein
MWNVTILSITVVLGMALCCSSAFAQSGAGSIQGTVTDSTGAVIPGASIHVVNQATAVATDTKSNGVGLYQVPDLFTGSYDVTVAAPAFQTYKTRIDLLVAQNAFINAALTPGSVTQQVMVSANAVQLTTTDNGTVASTLENARINQLPMNGQNLVNLVGETTPGVEGDRANGLMAEGLEYVVDGVTLTDRQFGGEKQSEFQVPNPDAVQEVRIETSASSAEYAEPTTAVLTTKSGTNALHGSLFETARNNGWGIAKDRQDLPNFSAPHYVRNEFGASVGGPNVLPHIYHGKDKSFWFFAYERYSLASAQDELVTVPTPAMKQGDFSGLVSSAGILQQLYDPATTGSPLCNHGQAYGQYCRMPFGGNPNGSTTTNYIPISRLSPTSKIIDDILPNPSFTYNPLVTTNSSVPDNSIDIIPNFNFRIDHVFNENNRAYLRFTNDTETDKYLRNNPADGAATIAADGIPADASGVTYTPYATEAGSIGFTHVFSPTFFSETVVSQQWLSEHNFAAGSPFTNFEQELGLPNNFGETGFPFFGNGDSMLESSLEGTMYNYGMSQIITTLDENLTKAIGRHQLQFGGRYRHERFGDMPDASYDYVNFGADATALELASSGTNYSGTPNTGYYQGDFFLGAASSYEVEKQPLYGHYHDMEFDGYVQDNFHVSRNFTANLGLRYEGHPAAWTKYGQMEGFDLKNDAMVLASTPASLIAQGFTTQAIITNLENIGAVIETPAEAGMPANTLMDNYDFTFGPRVGLAYQPFGGKYGTVIRGAYGRYIYPMPTRSYMKFIQQDPPYTAAYTQSYTAANQSPDGLANYLMRAPQPVVMGTNSANVVNSSTVNSILPGVNLHTFTPDMAPDYVTDMNATIEQPLKGNSVLRLSWVWSHGTNLDQQFNYNEHPSTYAWEMKTGTALPTGSVIDTPTYAATGTGPFDKTTWGGSTLLIQKTGYSNDNALQANFQRLFHHGVAYQIFYTWSKPFRVGGNSFRDGTIDPAADYVGTTGMIGTMSSPYPVTAPALPPAAPAGLPSYAFYRGLNVYENYQIDSAIPKQHIRFNGIVDLPFGRGKRFMGNSNRFIDELVGGWQIAGDGNIVSQDFAVASSNWGPTNPLHVYKHNAPITDCRSGTCYKAYEWFNGYIAPGVVNAATAGVSGLPSGWAPYSSPIDTAYPNTDKYYNTNDVSVTLANGTTVNGLAYSPGPIGVNPFSHTYLNGPINWTADLSLFKVFPITEKANLRFNMDAFNAFNVQGYTNPNTTDGTEAIAPGGVSSSANSPRQIQFTLRLTF